MPLEVLLNPANPLFNIIYIMRSLVVEAKFKCPPWAKLKCPLWML